MYFILYTSLHLTFCIYFNKLLHVSIYVWTCPFEISLFGLLGAVLLMLHVSSFLFVNLGGLYSVFSSPPNSLDAMRNESQGYSALQ